MFLIKINNYNLINQNNNDNIRINELENDIKNINKEIKQLKEKNEFLSNTLTR